MILGLDCSTTCCGWALYNGVSILDAGFIDLSKHEGNKAKAFHILETLVPLPLMAELTEIRLEAALSGFMRGRTSQQVVILLARFNAVLEYILGEELKKPVILVSANTARKKVFGKAFIKGMTAKEYVAQELPKHVSNLETYYKLNKRQEFDKRNEDLRDAIVIAMS